MIFSGFRKENVGGLLGGGGQRVCWPPPPLKLLWGPAPSPPPLPPLFLRLWKDFRSLYGKITGAYRPVYYPWASAGRTLNFAEIADWYYFFFLTIKNAFIVSKRCMTKQNESSYSLFCVRIPANVHRRSQTLR